MTPVSIRLRELREARGLTQVELADAIGVSQKTISLLESGRKPRADLDQLTDLCRELGVTMAELVPVPPRKRR